MNNPQDIVKKPLISEKSAWEGERHNRVTFEVAMNARKPQIKEAVEALYGVRVVSVATQVRRGRQFRNRYGKGVSAPWKRAVVQLHGDDRIELF